MRYRYLRRTTIALLATIAVALVLGWVLLRCLHSERATSWVLTRLQQVARAELGAQLHIGKLGWQLLPPRILLQEVTLERPGLQAAIERVSVDLNQVRLLRPALQLGSVAAEGVTLKLDGLPEDLKAATPAQGRRTGTRRIEVEQLDLRRLQLEGTGLPGSFERVVVQGMAAGWSERDRRQHGFLRVDRLLLELRGVEPIEAAIRGRISTHRATRSTQIHSWAITAPGLELHGSGAFSQPARLQLEGSGDVSLAEVDRVVRGRGVLRGSCQLQVNLDTSRDDLLLIGVRSTSVVRAAGFPIQQMRGQLRLNGERLLGVLDRATFHRGLLSGTYTLGGRLRRPFPHQVQAQVQGIDVASLLENLGVPAAGLAARADLLAEMAWNGRSFPRGSGSGSARFTPASGTLPVTGELAVRLTPQGLLHFQTSDLHIGSSLVQWQGPLTIGSWVPAWSVRANPAELQELLPMVNTWMGARVLPEELRGVGELQVTLAGPWRQLQAGIRLETTRLTYPPVVFDRLLAEATVSGDTLKIGPARYRIAGGSGEVEGRIAWGEAAGDEQLDLTLRGQGIPLAVLASWLGTEQGVAGSLTFTGGLRGPVRSPRGSWALALGDLEVLGQRLGDGSGTLDLADGIFSARGLTFSEGLRGSVAWHLPHQVSADLSWPEMPLEMAGERVADLLGQRADAHTRFLWSKEQPLAGELTVAGTSVTLEMAAGEEGMWMEAALGDAVTATVRLERSADDRLQGGGEVELLAADYLVQRLLPEAGVPLSGRGRLVFTCDWPPHGLPLVTGRVDELDLDLAGQPVTLRSSAPITLSHQGLRIEEQRLILLGDAISLRGAVAADGSLQGELSGTLDALVLRFLAPGWEPAGRISGAVKLLGTAEHPLFAGTTQLAGVSFRLPGSRQVLSHIDGTVVLSPDEVRLEGIDLHLLQGSGHCDGRITTGDGISLLLTGHVADLEYPLLPGLTPRVSGELSLEGTPAKLELSGDLQVDRAVLRRQDDPASILIDWMESLEQPATEGGFDLNLRLTADRTIEARSPFLNLTGSAALVISGTSGQPGLVGKVELHEGGDFTFQGVRYEIERGSLTFSDPTRFDPFIQLQARAWVQSYQVMAQLSGTTDRLVPVLSSDPPLTESEIISLLALGRPDESVGGGAMGVGLASTLLTRQLNAELERRARTLLPVDKVRVDPFAEHATGNPAARVTLVKQLSPSWTIILQSNLSSNREEVILSRWFLGPGLFLEATRDVDGSYGVDIKLRRRY